MQLLVQSKSISIKTNLADLPIVGGVLDGATITTGYMSHDHSTVVKMLTMHMT